MNKIAEEITCIRRKALPMPSYFFCSRFGRQLSDSFEELNNLCGDGESMIFKPYSNESKSLLNQFQVKAETASSLGRRFSGTVLVELPSAAKPEELKELFSYLSDKSDSIYCMFSMENGDECNEVQRLLEKYFLVRRIEGEEYSVDEQLEIFKKAAADYGCDFSEEAFEALYDRLQDYEWDPSEAVENRIVNIVSNIVYDRILLGEEKRTIGCEEVGIIADRLFEKEEHKRRIGFCVEVD